MKSITLRTVLLTLLNVGLIGLAAYLWISGEARVREPASLAIHPVAAPDLSVLTTAATPPVNVAMLRDQAVFYSRRSFYQPPPASELVPPPEYELAGIMGLPQGKRIAFVKKKSDATSRTLHVGDELDGWHVDAIDPSRVVIARADQHVELVSGQAPSTAQAVSASKPVHPSSFTVRPPATLAHVRVLGGPRSTRALVPSPRPGQTPSAPTLPQQ